MSTVLAMFPKSRQGKMIKQFKADKANLYVTKKVKGCWISLLKLEKGNSRCRRHFKMLSKEVI